MPCIPIFFILPFLGYYFGTQFIKKNNQNLFYEDKQFFQETKEVVLITDVPEDLIFRCGDIPSGIPAPGRFISVSDPKWASDCRHISWSFYNNPPSGWFSEEDSLITPYQERSVGVDEGLFLYTDSNKSIKRIAFPDSYEDSILFKEWKDSDTILYAQNNKTYMFEISLNKTTLVE